MTIAEGLHYNPQVDFVEGFCDFGGGRRSKKIASHALVFMVRGATKKWKQVIGYFLYAGSLSWSSLKDMVDQALRYCSEANLTVVAIVCDQETSQMRLLKEVGVTHESPYITDSSSGHKVAVIPVIKFTCSSNQSCKPAEILGPGTGRAGAGFENPGRGRFMAGGRLTALPPIVFSSLILRYDIDVMCTELYFYFVHDHIINTYNVCSILNRDIVLCVLYCTVYCCTLYICRPVSRLCLDFYTNYYISEFLWYSPMAIRSSGLAYDCRWKV